MKKVVVTGGAGFIGSNLVDELAARGGYEIHVIDNLSAGVREHINQSAILHVADIREIEKIRPIFSDAAFVFHLAAMPRVQDSIDKPIETHAVNVDGTLNVLMCARDAGVEKLVFSSSSAVYGDHEMLPLSEDLKALPKSPYGLHKHIGELYCRIFSEVYNLPAVSLRYFNVYGKRLNPDGAYALVIGRFLKQLKENKPLTITGDGLQTRDFINIKDIVRANIMAAESENLVKGEVINIGSGIETSILELAELFGGTTEFIESRIEPRKSKADISKARELLGFEPTIGLEEGIRELKEEWGL